MRFTKKPRPGYIQSDPFGSPLVHQQELVKECESGQVMLIQVIQIAQALAKGRKVTAAPAMLPETPGQIPVFADVRNYPHYISRETFNARVAAGADVSAIVGESIRRVDMAKLLRLERALGA